jgi:hypothetical protein
MFVKGSKDYAREGLFSLVERSLKECGNYFYDLSSQKIVSQKQLTVRMRISPLIHIIHQCEERHF